MAVAFPHCESHLGRLLSDHLQDVAARIRSVRPSDELLFWTGLFHDIGKSTAYFQTYLNGGNASRDLRAHAHFGAIWLLAFMVQQRKAGLELGITDLALAHLFAKRHHGRLDDLIDSLAERDSSETERFEKQLSATDVSGLCRWLSQAIDRPCETPESSQRLLPLNIELQRQFIDERKTKACNLELMGRFQKALADFGTLIEADRDSAAGYERTKFEAGPLLRFQHVESSRTSEQFGDSSPAVKDARESVYRSAVESADRLSCDAGHLWSLTVPTGAGKTLAAIAWATKRREARIAAGRRNCPIIYALPFTSIIDQNVAVLRRLRPDQVVSEDLLAVHHHLAELGEIAESGEESLARSWVEGWRSDIVCTTFVQIVNALFHGRCADSRRFSKLAGSILILDEVQAVPAELWTPIRIALQSLSSRFGTDILLVTATQPALFAESEILEIGPSSIPVAADTSFDRYDVETLLASKLTLPSLSAKICSTISSSNTQSCLVILNTIQESLDLYSTLRQAAELSTHRFFHLSTNLRPKDRRRILADLANCSVPHILVATQVVEAGVDLSFDVVFRALAPLDSIVQAAGRCNRHGTGTRGHVFVFQLEDNYDSLIYGDLHLDLSRRILSRTLAENIPHSRSEPMIRACVVEYFKELSTRVGQIRSDKILDAVRQLEFAALRGEGFCQDKRVQLIEDIADRVPHFVETDESDTRLWGQFLGAVLLRDAKQRRRELHLLRTDMGQRVVEVPSRMALGSAEPSHGFVHVPISQSYRFYCTDTGWRRSK